MGVQHPGKAPGPSTQQLERQLQMVVNSALKALDSAKPMNPAANQAEVDSLRSLIWSELTGLEAEFGREDGPRADRVERFFHHLISNGDYVGQIEALGSALLGGEPPPSQPAPGSSLAELHQVHNSLASLRKQWQQQAATASSPQPVGPARPSAQTPPPPAAPLASNGHAKQGDFRGATRAVPQSWEQSDDGESRNWRPAASRTRPQPARKAGGVERILKDLGFGNLSPTAPMGETEPPLPRAVFTYVSVIVILTLFGIGVIYLGLSAGPKPEPGAVLTSTQTITIPTAAGTPSPTPTLNAALPELVVQGDNLQVPCASSKQTTGFILKNGGGQILSWSSQVKTIGGIAPVSLNPPSGQLSGGAGTNTKVITVTAVVDTSVTSTITISSNGGTQIIQVRVIGC